MAKNWWFKFEYRVWQSDPDLSGCSLAARGLWLEILCSLYAQDEHTLTASYERLGRMARCDSSEIAKLVVELKQNKVADVTLGHGDVTVTSRRLKKLLKARKDATLRKQKERVTQKSQDRVKSKSNKKEVREEKSKNAASPLTRESGIQPADEWDAMDAHTLGYPLADLFKFFPRLTLSSGQMGMIQAEVKDTPHDRAAWSATIEQYVGNHDPATKSYLPQKVGNLLSVFKAKRQDLEKQNGSSKNGNRKRTDEDVLTESIDFYESNFS